MVSNSSPNLQHHLGMLAKIRSIYQKGHKRSCLQQHSGQQKQLKNGHNNDLPMMLQKKLGI